MCKGDGVSTGKDVMLKASHYQRPQLILRYSKRLSGSSTVSPLEWSNHAIRLA